MADGEEPKYERVLVVCAHPDDPEFAFGATIAKLAGDGVEVVYVVCTDGAQGGEDPSVPDAELTATREQEQRDAARVLGVKEVVFLGYRDGSLSPSQDLRREISRQIRRFRPDLVLTHYPTRNLAYAAIGAFHPDHTAVGEATMCAVYPDARNPRAFTELLAEGLEPHRVREVWTPGFTESDHVIDATPFFEAKLNAIRCHRSQVEKPGQSADDVDKWVRERMRQVGEKAGYEYAEGFRRIVIF
jgi:LmbE family N-acetylglucosaminyl deacetylase